MDMVALKEVVSGAILEYGPTWGWLIALAVFMAVLKPLASKRRPRFRRFRGRPPRNTGNRQAEGLRSDESRLGDPKAQMEFISRVDFEPRRLLNKPEYGILQILEKITREIGGGHRVMAQTSLGEIIAPARGSGSEESRNLAFRSINSKRLDFLVIDRIGLPTLAVEYQGHGHYQNGAFMRDAVKREAVRKAKVQFLEIEAEYDATVLEDRIRSALRPDPQRTERRRSFA